ncbi:hypothetical protein GTGU_04652 [Trabulsiella guamensis ATCC 49490]|uniref:Eaa family phage protein n=1 Tax=Trabulsiella guamensis ATCC 49490 TaxID=1005994 RepID=A0A084ZIB4_9ENTR|nr:hypothetical protein [Trabulsiella guamensis]KFB97208.1 hypothetical protein GTGU_04652 [Trabulsiella guamensis ATCC 49490]
MTTITREEIEHYLHAAEQVQLNSFDRGKLISVPPWHMVDLARMALASLEAEPVAWTDAEELRDVKRYGFAEMFSVEPISANADPLRIIPLFTTQPAPMSKAATDVLEERQRQITAEGWTPEHDDEHSNGEMAIAASSYARYAHTNIYPVLPLSWPWEAKWFKQQGARRDLVKAGALILAEIERIDRAADINNKGGE